METFGPEVLGGDGEEDSGGGGAVGAVVAFVASDADHFAPDALGVFADPFPDGRGSGAPKFDGKIFGYLHDGAGVVDVVPSDVPAGFEGVSHGLEVIGAYELVPAHGRDFAVAIGLGFGEDRVVAVVAVSGQGVGDAHGFDAGDGGEPIHDLLLEMRDLRTLFDEGLRHGDAKGHEFFRLREPGFDALEGLRGADHEPCPDEQD